MRNIKIKICGITSSTILDCCNELNINFFGLIFYRQSPRNIEIEKAKNLIKYQNKKNSIPVGVFVNHNFEDLSQIIQSINLKYIQLHGKEDNDYIKQLKNKHNVKVIKAIKLENDEDLLQINSFSKADFFLFDYKPKKNELPGGNAKSFNWLILKDKNIGKPWFISGGINKNNINELLKNIIPYGIDISSGVEDLPGIKNEKKIREILRIIYG